MMGRLEPGQERLFYNFRLEDHIPANHLVRQLDVLLDFSSIRDQLASCYSDTGRPCVDPELMVRMLLLGYCYSSRSSLRLCCAWTMRTLNIDTGLNGGQPPFAPSP